MFESQFSVAAYALAVAAKQGGDDEERRYGRCPSCGCHDHTKAYGPMVSRKLGDFPGLSGHCSRHPMWEKARAILLFYQFLAGR